MSVLPSYEDYDPTNRPQPLLLKDASLLLDSPYLPLETGYGFLPDGMYHVCASTYMRGCTGAMIDWWFDWLRNTEQYKLWHPRDHVYSTWRDPAEKKFKYIGGHHLVREYIGGVLGNLWISFVDPAEYFGAEWTRKFKEAGYSTAVCARTGIWNDDDRPTYVGHLIHLIKDEPDGCRMRSRFWIGDIDGVSDANARASAIPEHMRKGLVKHCTEEMAILATRLPSLYADFAE